MPWPLETQIKSGVIGSNQFFRNVLVQDFLHGQGDYDFVATPFNPEFHQYAGLVSWT
jgi:beta-N-acetylglucosaminidase